MELILLAATLATVITLYFRYNPLRHERWFMIRRFISWFPLGMTYAFLYMGRYNLSVTKNAMGTAMTKEDFGLIFGAGTIVYGLSFLLNGPIVDRIGGKKGIIIAAIGSSIMNVGLGVATYLYMNGLLTTNMTVTFAVIYSMNMFFQSYGAVSIIKVKAYWFHVRERGIFGAIFGTLISLGVYFAFDWGQAIATAAKRQLSETPTAFQTFIHKTFALDVAPTGSPDAIWLVFFVPAAILAAITIVDYLCIADSPSHAGLMDFDTHDASSGDEKEYTMGELLMKMFRSPLIMTIAFIEFTTGVIRNGVLQWYFIFAKEVPQPGAEFFKEHWGALLCISGIIGGFMAGHLSDKFFHSRRGPPVAIACAISLILAMIMTITLFSSPFTVGVCAVGISLFSIATHSLMSGTAAADFGGRKATATASGITDGFVYLGTGIQSIGLGYLTSQSWIFWPVFIIPFIILGLFLAVKMWAELPEATRKYLLTVEKVSLTVRQGNTQATVETIKVSET
jgi:OPA family glycerol-3-phosphate transporter-like MFS transporter